MNENKFININNNNNNNKNKNNCKDIFEYNFGDLFNKNNYKKYLISNNNNKDLNKKNNNNLNQQNTINLKENKISDLENNLINNLLDITNYNKQYYIYNKEYLNKYCTSFYFGYNLIKQNAYLCYKCDPTKKICKYCYESCHKNCKINNNINKEILQPCEFSCNCGNSYKHLIIDKPSINNDDNLLNIEINYNINCEFIKFDNENHLNYYFCVNHNVNICNICSIICHNNCNLNLNNNEFNYKCLCENKKNHNIYNSIIFNFISNNDYFEQLNNNIKIWPIQFLNYFYSKHFFNIFEKVLSEGFKNINYFNNIKFLKIFNILLNSFTDMFKYNYYLISTYYYHSNINNFFNIETLIIFLENLNKIK